ncbi:MAG TPA: divalent-cation tolerance protein CutA [Longimicrobium sp.]|jgi:periplasmic divalent cation tolerance protein
MHDGADLALVFMTAPDAAAAERVGRALVEERLAACATVIPGVTSVYRWEGEVRAEAEVQLLLKTRRGLVDRLFRRAAELHPYKVPELLAAPLAGVSEAYRRWVLDETGQPEDQQGGGAELPRATRVDDGSE